MIICPTVLATDTHSFREQMERIAPFALRVQIDLSDGEFSPVSTVPIGLVWWPHTLRADLHIMYQRPFEVFEEIIALSPGLVIVHAEADGDFLEFASRLKAENIAVGVALLAETDANNILNVIENIDHVLIFSGNLGNFGGTADLSLLEKVAIFKEAKPSLEIGWDGGVNNKNIQALVAGGVDVLNVGRYIQKADNPEQAYGKLLAELENR